MKKIFIYFCIFIVVTFAIPIIFTKSFNEKKEAANLDGLIDSNIDNTNNSNNTENNENSNQNTSDNKEENNSNNDKVNNKEENKSGEDLDSKTNSDISEYKKYNTVKLLHTKTNVVEEIPIDKYLYGVVSAEMPANFEKEALKAQSIVARTYTLYKILQNNGKHEGADICDDSSCCQSWISKVDRLNKWEEDTREANWNKIVSSVEETKGKIITYEGKPINAFFHSNSGGTTEVPVNVWGGTNYPYLQTVETSGEDAYTQYYSEVKLSKDELINKMKNNYNDFEINFEDESQIQIMEYTNSGRVKTIKIGNKNLSGVEVRALFSLKSANFQVKKENDEIIFSVLGYGHGVGMSQTGADSLAKEGKNAEEIIKHFYTGVDIVTIQ